MGKSKVGERYSISLGLVKAGNDVNKDLVVYNDASLHTFEFSIPMNWLPTGHTTIVCDAASVGNPSSGSYGKMLIEGLKPGGKVMELPVYINALTRSNISQDVVKLDVSFTLGNEKLQSVMESVAVEGTSVDAANKLFGMQGLEIIDEVSPAKGSQGVSDNMIWRFVAGTLPEHMLDIMTHSSLPGDLLYWVYDDAALTFRLGTFNVSKSTKRKNFFMYTSDAVTTTSSATHGVKGTDTSIWYYSGYVPSDTTGETREARSPNLVIDSTASGSAKDVGTCSKDCWKSVIGAMGANGQYLEEESYGPQKMVKPFPSNTHKTYAIAPHVRQYMLAEYSKVVTLRLYNHPGPAVGSCVYFYASSPKLKTGDFLPDEHYTARYIVVNKKIIKAATVNTGLLGRERPANTSDLVTEITMVSNAGYNGFVSADYKQVVELAGAITRALDKETKK